MTEASEAPAAGSAEQIPWRSWNAAYEVPEAERDQWAKRVTSGDTISVQCGDSIVWSEADEGEVEITDVLVRRTARVPMPAGYMDRSQLITALVDLLEEELRENEAIGIKYDWCRRARSALHAAGRKASNASAPSGAPKSVFERGGGASLKGK